MSLFDYQNRNLAQSHEPLAARMRPRTLDEFWGQSHILAPGRLLRRAIEADQLSSLIFYGPPGTGKTTLARIIANYTHARFISLNAVLAGLKDIRESIDLAKQSFNLGGRKSILFIDEVHRFNKTQQDALLPWVENGTITLIGATTENPFFEVNQALLSRSRVFQLKSLEAEDLRSIARQALADEDRGFGLLSINLVSEALEHLVNVANGDARALLNALELAVSTSLADESGIITIDLGVAEESIQQRAVLYDKEGDAHFDTISAFIKSVRGSDPDASLYWLAKMLVAGESPNFIFRRLLILACEDIGLADPSAVSIVSACAQAFDRIGLPEGRYHLAHATLYLATTEKSNSSLCFFDALACVEKERNDEVPNHLKDASRDSKGLGHGAGYLYPHAYRDHWVGQQYLPHSLQGRIFYQPGEIGYESKIAARVHTNRERQLAAIDEAEQLQTIEDSWIARSFDNASDRAMIIRDRVFELARVQENDRVLDINTGTGLFSWEILRAMKTGSLTCILEKGLSSESFHALLRQRDPLNLVNILHVEDSSSSRFLIEKYKPSHPFDLVVGRNFIKTASEAREVLDKIRRSLDSGGRAVFAHSIFAEQARIYALCPAKQLVPAHFEAWREAEEKILAKDNEDSLSEEALRLAASDLDIDLKAQTLDLSGSLYISAAIFQRWFGKSPSFHEPSYIQRLSEYLDAELIENIVQWASLHLRNTHVSWPSKVLVAYFSKL